jgi:hypothetical protein
MILNAFWNRFTANFFHGIHLNETESGAIGCKSLAAKIVFVVIFVLLQLSEPR